MNGLPGVRSARFAGENSTSDKNINLVLKSLQNKKNRSATFRTVICLLINDKKHFFEGKVSGKISKHKSGKSGFGYDPIFIPDGYKKMLAGLFRTFNLYVKLPDEDLPKIKIAERDDEEGRAMLAELRKKISWEEDPNPTPPAV